MIIFLRYIFPLCFHLARGGGWGESPEDFERRREREKRENLREERAKEEEKELKENVVV